MSKVFNYLYEFDSFQVNPKERLLTRHNKKIPLPPKAFDLLLIFLENSGHLMLKDELLKAGWPDTTVEEGNINLAVTQIRQALGDKASKPKFIQTVHRQGYRFIGDVKKIPWDIPQPNEEEEPASSKQPEEKQSSTTFNDGSQLEHNEIDPRESLSSANLESVFGGHSWFVFLSSGLYALLYSIELFVEVAYQFDQYKQTAFIIAPIIFFWIFSSTLASFAIAWNGVLRGKAASLVVSVTIFFSAAAIVFIGIYWFLPATPVTQASFQTMTAQTAYLKWMFGFLTIGLFFLIVPYHFVITIQSEVRAKHYGRTLDLLTSNVLIGRKRFVAPNGTLYPRFWSLALLLIFIASIVMGGYIRLSEGLIPSPHLNLFAHLILIRLFLYLILGIQALAWYYRKLNEIKRECLRNTSY